MMKVFKISMLFITLAFSACSQGQNNDQTKGEKMSEKEYPISKTEQEWKDQLSDQEYLVLRKAGTERAFTGEFYKHHDDGTYTCKGCGNSLFDSDTKYESGSGWPSFYDVVSKANVELIIDKSHGMIRTEVRCAKCGGHLGHVFDDGPNPTGLRYCINSASLGFKSE